MEKGLISDVQSSCKRKEKKKKENPENQYESVTQVYKRIVHRECMSCVCSTLVEGWGPSSRRDKVPLNDTEAIRSFFVYKCHVFLLADMCFDNYAFVG